MLNLNSGSSSIICEERPLWSSCIIEAEGNYIGEVGRRPKRALGGVVVRASRSSGGLKNGT